MYLTGQVKMSEIIFKQVFYSYLDYLISQKGSDLHLSTGNYPLIRVDNDLKKIKDKEVVTNKNLESLVEDLLNEEQKERLRIRRQVDFSLERKGGFRFRGNIFYCRGVLSLCMRAISKDIKDLKSLNLPESLYEFVDAPQGLFLTVGPNGHGKSTTLAALIEYVNENYTKHIVTIEDPIEYVYSNKKSLIEQRELYTDTPTFVGALESCFREDVDIILVGEMRNMETIATAITAAETGHLVLATLHTNDAVQTVDRMIDVFPPHQQNQIRQQLANVLIGVVSQRLVNKIGGGRIPSIEVLKNNKAISNLIRSDQTHQIKSFLETSREEGMFTFEHYLADLIKRGLVDWQDAEKFANDLDGLRSLIKSS
jgi:twitching motility protein PilT